MKKEEILEILKNVYDPDYRDKSIVEMGLVTEDDIEIFGDTVHIEYGVTAPLCPFAAALGVMLKYALERRFKDIKIEVRIKPGHFQEKPVNEILNDKERRQELLKTLESYGIIEQCVRV